jgi:hypothetical protein
VARKRSRVVPAIIAVVAIVVVVSLVLGGVNLGNPVISPNNQTPQLGSFAGYIGYEQVTQISATWHVPAILSLSPDGAASTWIGVQGPGQKEFFQVGTTESYEAGTEFYEAFWSDPAEGFHAQVMMQVAAGDEIRALITEVSGSWQANIDDVTSGQSQQAPTYNGVFTNLQLAEWIQEDPALPRDKHVPYPDIAPTTMSQLRVNGSAPGYSSLQPQIMVLPQGRRVDPGPLVSDQFTTKDSLAT